MRPRCAISRHFPHRFADTKSVDMAGGGEHVHFRPVHEFCFVFFFESKRMESIRPGVKNTKISKAFPLNSGTCQIKSERDHAPSRPPPAARPQPLGRPWEDPTMRLFKRRASDPAPQLVSLAPINSDMEHRTRCSATSGLTSATTSGYADYADYQTVTAVPALVVDQQIKKGKSIPNFIPSFNGSFNGCFHGCFNGVLEFI